jgi:Mg-chelatase subunit ChlD
LVLTVARRPEMTLRLFGAAVELERPAALVLLALLPLVAAAGLDRFALTLVDLPRAQQALSTALRAFFVSALAFALARPAVRGERATVSTVILVDVSASISEPQLERARQLVEAARKERAQHPDDTLALVTFGRRATRLVLPPDGTALGPIPRADPADKEGTDLEAALQLAYGLYPPGTIRRAVLITDGNETEGNLLVQAEGARARGVHVDHVTAPGAGEDEVLVRAVHLPPDVKLGAPFEVTAEVYASSAQHATVTLYRDEFVNPLEGRKEIDLEPGKNVIRWKGEVTQPGFTTFRAVLGGKLKDHFAANNQAAASAIVKGKPRVLYVEGEPQAGAYLSNALKRENIDVELRSGYGLPADPRELARYDLVILSDVAATFVGEGAQAAIEAYVRDLGGGFIMAGGENSFGSGGYGGTRMEKVLPVRLDSQKKRDQPGLALVLVIDRSGSMTGEKIELAKDAAKATAELLGRDDLIGVVAFDSLAQPVVRLQRASNRVRIASDISRIQVGGGTNILPALKEAFDELDPAHAKVKHVIFLTDGQASYDGIPELCDEMVQHKITISAVGVGQGADRTLLTMMAERGGGRFYFTQDAQNVPKIFVKETTEVARSALVEEAVRVHVVKRAEFLDGVGIEDAPPLRGYVATKEKPLTDLILSSDLGEPILARWHVGLGQVAAFTSDVKNRWAADWVHWPGYGKFWAHLVRSTMRHSLGGGAAGYTLEAEVDPPVVRVAVDAVSADDKYVSGLDTTLEVIDPAHPQKKRTVPMPQVAAGRYEAEVPLSQAGTYLLRAVHRRGGVQVAESTGAVAIPYAAEYLALPPNEGLLERVAQVTGGRAAPTVAQLFDAGSERVTFHRELWALCLWLAALLLLLDIAARRITFARG